jgi:hypothetical protein
MSPSRSTIRTRNRISLASGAGDERSPLGLLGAVVLHLAVVGITLFTWEHRLDIVDQSPPVVPVDLVTIAQKTNINTYVRPVPKIAPVPLPQPQPQHVDMPTPQVPEQQSELAPEPVVKPVPPKPRPEPPKKSAADKLADLVNQLSAPTAQPAHTKAIPAARAALGNPGANTMDLSDALRNAIEQCWSPPAGAPHPEQLIVYVELRLNPDGSVAGAPQLTAQSQAAVSGSPFMHAAAEAAMRAIYVCAPYKLPADRYADWRDSTVKFDPRDLVGQ